MGSHSLTNSRSLRPGDTAFHWSFFRPLSSLSVRVCFYTTLFFLVFLFLFLINRNPLFCVNFWLFPCSFSSSVVAEICVHNFLIFFSSLRSLSFLRIGRLSMSFLWTDEFWSSCPGCTAVIGPFLGLWQVGLSWCGFFLLPLLVVFLFLTCH